jgi:formate hydrogenlyase subunit 6/NADH:ubiquinone oxidoreductase subunit I
LTCALTAADKAFSKSRISFLVFLKFASCLYCNICDELLCPLCIAKTHNKQHDLIEISEGYQIRAEKIRNGQKNIDQKIQLQIRGEEDLGKIKLQEHANFKKKQDFCPVCTPHFSWVNSSLGSDWC